MKPTILMVDDENINLLVLERILNEDYTLYKATNGTDAIRLAKRMKPDIILLDIMMPGLTGFDVITELKNTERTRDIPVIYVTGLDSADDEEKGLLLGAADYISKPFSSAVVKSRIENQISSIKRIRELQEKNITDALTGIHNRRYFNAMLDNVWAQALETNTTVGFIILDIDHFKSYNDRYGHLNGDIVLQDVAKILSQRVKRASDYVARWGGEEFAIILSNTPIEGAAIMAEDIRKLIENYVFVLGDGTETRATVSLGVHSVAPGIETDYDLVTFLSDADKALYQAKQNGRNQTNLVYDDLAKWNLSS